MNKSFALICVAPVRVHAVYVVVVCLRIVFSKAALQKRGSMEPIETLLPPPPRSATACVTIVPISQPPLQCIWSLLYEQGAGGE